MGHNGSGKTTLLKILLGDVEPDAGEVKRGHLVEVGYLDQHLKILPEDKPLLRAVWPHPDPDLDQKRMHDLLGRIDLPADIVYQPMSELSRSERHGACLAKLTTLGGHAL